MKKKSFLEEIKDVQLSVAAKRDDYTSHLILGVECDEEGHPSGNMVQCIGSPYQTLGMIEVLMRKLEITKEEILDKLDEQDKDMSFTHPDSTIDIMKNIKDEDERLKETQSRAETLINKLPPVIQEKMRAFKKKMDEAVERRDSAELLKLLQELKSGNPLSSDEDTDLGRPSEDFDINDFKG